MYPGLGDARGPTMTEQEWLECTDPVLMLEYLRGRAGDRKLRLFACACCRRVWHLLRDERSRALVELAESYAEGAVSLEELEAAGRDAFDAPSVPWQAAWSAVRAATGNAS